MQPDARGMDKQQSTDEGTGQGGTRDEVHVARDSELDLHSDDDDARTAISEHPEHWDVLQLEQIKAKTMSNMVE